MFGDIKTECFFKFSDRDPLQADHGSQSLRWIHDPERIYIEPKAFDEANSYFDKANSLDEPVNSFLTGNVLHVYHSTLNTGLTLPVPTEAIVRKKAFTVELWIALKEITSGNFTILGVPNQQWDQGFSIAGVMTSTTATISCVFDTGLTSNMLAAKDNCYADTKLCFSTKIVNTWYHILCSREDLEPVAASGDNAGGDNPEDSKGNVAKVAMALNFEAKDDEVELKAGIEELFSAGKIVIGTKYDEETGLRTRSFNGYIRELRIWSRAIGVDFARYVQRERLDPMEHGTLVAYWPLFSGILNNFIELSGHSIDITSEGTENTNYNGGAIEWIENLNLSAFTYCHKGYIYSPQSSSCILKKPYTALYIDYKASSSCEYNIPNNNKEVTNEGVTLSIWVYLRTGITEKAIFIGITDIAEIQYIGSTLTGYIKGINSLPASGFSLPIGRWVHYGLTASKSIGAMYLFYDGNKNKVDVSDSVAIDSTFNTFTIGKSMIGSVREAKIWSTGLVTKKGDNLDFSEMRNEKFQ